MRKSIPSIALAALAGGFFLVWTAGAQDGKTPSDQCVKPAQGPILGSAAPNAGPAAVAPIAPRVRIGKPAPDFEAHAFLAGGFEPVRLSKYRGKWVILCFYPGDFTFV